MDAETMQTEETNEAEINETQEVEQDLASTDEVAQPEAQLEGEEAEPVESEFTPDFTYKALGEEKEIPENIRSLISDQESNEYWKKTFSKIDAFDQIAEKKDHYKNEAARYAQEFEAFKSEKQDVLNQVDMYNHFVEKGDQLSALAALGVNQDAIIQTAVQLLEAQEKGQPIQDPSVNIQLKQYEDRVAQYEQQFQQRETEQALNQINNIVAENSDVVSAFDSQLGEGAFMKQLFEYGAMREMQGAVLTPDQAVNEFISKYCVGFKNAASQAPVETTEQPQVKAPAKPGTASIKTLTGGSSASVVKKRPSRISEIGKN
jgi:hypothetical protein